ncbi:MAG: hypothetical protein FWF15_09420, partial [Oscillospiraceae bacterium]|nr:hypothetical protein [Oscillospiraceae bacterium]
MGIKTKSVFYGKSYIEQVNKNIEKYEWAKELRDDAVKKAEYWINLSDDEIWNLMFGHTLIRSYTVWSEGYCPACWKKVPMVTWEIDAVKYPWKVQCPHCKELFPKNDFHKFYLSGLDEYGIFRYELADDTLLTNDDTPGTFDGSYRFGVDDGEGCVPGHCTQKRWYFIATYLARGQWKQLVVDGAANLARAYLMTGEQIYAHKAGIIFDRVADLLPPFDYHRQGYVYEMRGDSGYVTTWHDSNFEIRKLTIAYDAVYEGMRGDAGLVEFLNKKSKECKMPNKKDSFADIQYNIDTRIFHDVIKNFNKVHLNYPGEEILMIIIKLVMGLDGAEEIADGVFKKGTAENGVTGERGIGAYAGFTADLIFLMIEIMSVGDKSYLQKAVDMGIEKTFRFFTDIWFADNYYPQVGDTACFASNMLFFSGCNFINRIFGEPCPGFNLYTLLWRFYKLTGNEYYLKIIKKKAQMEKAVCDVGMFDAEEFYEAIKDNDDYIVLCDKSVLLDQWHLAALRSGTGENERAVWVHYEAKTKPHAHSDVMNIGIFAHGLDLLPENGYPPVHYGGGWFSTKALWYRPHTYMHNLVTVDRKGPDYSGKAESKVERWYDGDDYKAVSVSANGHHGTKLFERTLCMVDIDEKNSVIFDVFRIQGGNEHIKTTHSGYGEMELCGIDGSDTLTFTEDVLLKNITGGNVENGWQADWKIDDKLKLLKSPKDVHLKCYDLTENCEAYRSDMWIEGKDGEMWLPLILTRRTSNEELYSEFVTVYIPYENDCPVSDVS